MKGDKKVIEYLNRGLRSELTAINQYWLHYRMLDNWGLKDMAKTWKKESIEEMVHADRFVDRILFLEGFPNMQKLDALRIGENVKEVIEADLKAEIEARALYQEASTYCREVHDYPSEELFRNLMKDEEGHIDFLETQLELITRIGLELYTQKHMGELDHRRSRPARPDFGGARMRAIARAWRRGFADAAPAAAASACSHPQALTVPLNTAWPCQKSRAADMLMSPSRSTRLR
jgi:bacterioferritin